MLKNLSDYIMVIDDVLSPDVCEKFIETFENIKTEGPNKRTSRWEWELDYREFVELNIGLHQDAKHLNPYLNNTIQQIYEMYRTATKSEFLLPLGDVGFEYSRMKKYENNDHDQFGWHADVGDHESAKRALAMFIYLNDVKEGGETIFGSPTDACSLVVKPKAGRMVIFPPMWMFPHKGCKPISGPKYICSSYIHYL